MKWVTIQINKNFIEEGNKYISELKPSVDIIVLLVNVLDENLIDLSKSFEKADYIFLSATTTVSYTHLALPTKA